MHSKSSLVALAALHLAACSAPQAPEDGKPVAISPLGSSAESRETSTPVPERTATPKPSTVTLADYEKGTFDGLYTQERCAEGLRESTRLAALEVVRKTELFESGTTACDDSKRVSTTESTWTLVVVKGQSVDLLRTKETVTLHRESDVVKANERDAAEAPTPACVETWELNKPHGANPTAECAVAQKEHTLLSVVGDALRWGAPGQDAQSGDLLDGSTEKKRHAKLEDLPYVRKSTSP